MLYVHHLLPASPCCSLSQFRTNALGVAHTINAFLPLLRSGSTKKIVVLTTGMGDLNFVRDVKSDWNTQYAVSKAALHMIITQFALALVAEPSAEEGQAKFTVLGISPGMVATWDELPGESRTCSVPMCSRI